MIHLIAVTLVTIGLFFYLAGTVGMLRFPDTYTRLHGLTKADNLGLGFIVAGLAIESLSIWVTLKLVLIWGLALSSSATACYLIGNYIWSVRSSPGTSPKGGA